MTIEKEAHPNIESVAEKALRQSEEKYRTIFDNAEDMILIYSEKLEIIIANPLAHIKLGYTNLELTSLAAENINWQGESNREQERIAKLMEGGHLSYQTVFRHKDGTQVPVEVNARRITWDGQPAIMSICRDISERKTSEAALLASNIRLRQLGMEMSGFMARERQRLALSLHDEVAQRLALLRLRLGILGEKLGPVPEQAEIAGIREELGKALDQTHALVIDLSPLVLHHLDLTAALEWAGEKICRENGLRFSCVDDGKPKPLSYEVKALLFRCIREIMMNTVKHAKAAHLTLAIGRSGDLIYLSVEDDGCGFDVSSLDWRNPNLGFGLLSIRESLDAQGGRFEIVSEPGHRTLVRLGIPIQQTSKNIGRASDAESKEGARC